MAITEIGTFAGVAGNNFATIMTERGMYGMVTRRDQAVIIGPDGKVAQIATPQIHVGRLGVIDGQIVVDYTVFLGSLPGTEQDNPDRPWRRATTGISCGPQAGALVTGTQPAPPQGGTVSAPVDLAPLLAAVAKLAEAQDRMWTDVVGRLKAHEEADSNRTNAVARDVAALPDAVLGEVPAGDHFGLDPRAQFGNRWQELFVYALAMRQDALQVIIERFFEAARNMQAEGFDPATGQYKRG